MGCPYRKPTQVGKMSILRRARKPLSKELGKLTPYLRYKGCPRKEARSNEVGSTDCLAKTQHSAKSQDDV